MGRKTRVRAGYLVLLGGGMAAALLLSLAWGQSQNKQASADSPHPGLNFSLSVSGQPSCNTRQGDTLCILDPGARFTVNVNLDAIPADIGQYNGFDIEIDYTNVTSADNASTQAWPDCAFPATYFEAGLVSMGCATGLPPAPPSTYVGLIGTNDFTCSQSGPVSLKSGTGTTDLIDATSNAVHAEGAGTVETLNISCGPPPTPTLAPGVTPTTLPGGGSGGGQGTPSWLEICALLALAGAGLGTVGWKLSRAR